MRNSLNLQKNKKEIDARSACNQSLFLFYRANARQRDAAQRNRADRRFKQTTPFPLTAEQPVSCQKQQHQYDHAPYKIRKQHHDKHPQRHTEQRKTHYLFHSATSGNSLDTFYAFDLPFMNLPLNREYPLPLSLSSVLLCLP